MGAKPYNEMLENNSSDEDSLLGRIKSAGRAIVDDPGVQAGAMQIVGSLCALIVRAISPKSTSLVRREDQ